MNPNPIVWHILLKTTQKRNIKSIMSKKIKQDFHCCVKKSSDYQRKEIPSRIIFYLNNNVFKKVENKISGDISLYSVIKITTNRFYH